MDDGDDIPQLVEHPEVDDALAFGDDVPKEQRVPITIVTGYLGAGKTTL